MATIDLVVLNYNGRHLLEECLPSVVRAAAVSRHNCRVSVIDNASSDDSVELLTRSYPEVRQFHCTNRSLCSYNEVLPRLESPVVVLLNNDIKLAPGAVDPLVEPLLPEGAAEPGCFMTTPMCWLFDGQSYEGLQTALRWRWGLIQAISNYPGHDRVMHRACLTASAGAVLAVDRRKFLELDGFDPLYLPGRIEDLDFCFRGYLAGYHARYVPESVAYHKGEATFSRELGAERSQALALRNTLLFQWKNLHHPWHIVRHVAGLAPRLFFDLLRAPLADAPRRFAFTRALLEAVHRWRECARPKRAGVLWGHERQLLKELDWRQFVREAAQARTTAWRAGRVSVPVSPAHDHRFSSSGQMTPPGGLRLPLACSPSISIVCIVLNEEQNLPGLLERVGWADEVLVIDGGSRDATVEIARAFGATVYQRPFDNFARQQNFALSLARGDWVLSLDADERPTPAMIDEIRACVQQGRFDAYRVRVRSSIFGRRMRFSGTQDDRQVRLVRRGQAWWQGEVHETLEVAGAIGQLRSWLDHDPLPDLATFLAKMQRYTTLAAKARIAGGHPPRRSDAWLPPAREVFRRLLWKQGLWDGPQGWAFCFLSGLSEWVLADKHRRLWEAR
jgi:N-acetylglucosaminyl-diphospho-decaprenol L-rhamnosyltransferase